jgi:hypothetical protein
LQTIIDTQKKSEIKAGDEQNFQNLIQARKSITIEGCERTKAIETKNSSLIFDFLSRSHEEYMKQSVKCVSIFNLIRLFPSRISQNRFQLFLHSLPP